MNRHDSIAIAAEESRLYQELVRLTEEVLDEVRGSGEGPLEGFARRREALLERIGRVSASRPEAGGDAGEAHGFWRQSVDAIRRILELDGALVALLEARKTEIGEELEAITRGRRSLQSYRGSPPRSPSFVDRLG